MYSENKRKDIEGKIIQSALNKEIIKLAFLPEAVRKCQTITLIKYHLITFF